jgi:ribosomal protein S18 acetylase RimI-like enzyme
MEASEKIAHDLSLTSPPPSASSLGSSGTFSRLEVHGSSPPLPPQIPPLPPPIDRPSLSISEDATHAALVESPPLLPSPLDRRTRTTKAKGPKLLVEAKGIPGKGRIVIREMEIDDLAKVFHLGEDLFTAENFPILYRTWDPFEVTGMFHTDPYFCLVAENDNDEIIGFVMGTTIDKGTAWNYGYITWLGVAHGWQRRQVGQRLVDALEDRMLEEEDVRMFLVDTSAHNIRGIRFFQKQGFEHMQEHVYLWKTLKGDAAERARSVKSRRKNRKK